MLQQTQVERVVPFYHHFIKQFPTAKKLARAPLADVLKSWQGLGYNRRAKMLHEAAQELSRLNLDITRSNLVATLEKLPGVGPYTARAVAAFAYNQDVVFVETNIRTAILHHFFPREAEMSPAQGAPAARPIQPFAKDIFASRVDDAQISTVLEKLLPKGKSREWYSALMDYGAHLKKSGIQVNAKSSHYIKQSRFSGSKREARGAILKELAHGSRSESRVLGLLGPDRVPQMREALAALLAEQLVQKNGKVFTLPR